jgi:PAS domain S-box-containing protein
MCYHPGVKGAVAAGSGLNEKRESRMLVVKRRLLGWIIAGIGLSAVLFTAYLGLRAWRLAPEPSLPEQLIGATLLAAVAVAVVVWAVRRETRRLVAELSQHVATLRKHSSLQALQALSPEWGALYHELDSLGECYRQALDTLAEQTRTIEDLRAGHQQAEATLQLLTGRADAEQGRSQFRVSRGDNSSRNMVARLTPNLHWTVATPALQEFLGYPIAQLNGRSFLDRVPAEDVKQVTEAFQEALELGEAHNIAFRIRTRSGDDRHVQLDVLTRYSQESVPLHLRCHFVDITERVRTDEELRRMAGALRTQAEELQQANTKLRRINRELDDFSYVVSHDLKEPLRTLQAFSNFLAQDYAGQLGPEGEEFIGHLIEASRRLGALIDDLLTLSRAGRVLNSVQAFGLETAVATVKSDLADLIQRREATVRVEGVLPVVAGDPPRVVQLLTNLVSNGLKYNSSRRPEVVIGEQADKQAPPPSHNGDEPLVDRVTIFVRDNGIGIEPQYHEQIFRIFRRLHRREEYEGTGAGLAISKKIVEAHGGRIWVESQPRRGSTFYFTLPRAVPTLPSDGAPANGNADRIGATEALPGSAMRVESLVP